jgi:hypothetical protein
MNRDAGHGQCDPEQFGRGRRLAPQNEADHRYRNCGSISRCGPHESSAIASSVTHGMAEGDMPKPITSGRAATLRGPHSDIGTAV